MSKMSNGLLTKKTIQMGGQRCSVELVRTEDGTKYVRMISDSRYSYPTFTADDMVFILGELRGL